MTAGFVDLFDTDRGWEAWGFGTRTFYVGRAHLHAFDPNTPTNPKVWFGWEWVRGEDGSYRDFHVCGTRTKAECIAHLRKVSGQ